MGGCQGERGVLGSGSGGRLHGAGGIKMRWSAAAMRRNPTTGRGSAAAALAHPGPGGGRLCLRFARVRGVGNRGVVAGGDWGRFFLRGGVRQRREVWIEEHDGVGSVGGRPRWCAPAAGRRGAREKRMSEAESLRGGEKGGTVGVIALGWDGRMR